MKTTNQIYRCPYEIGDILQTKNPTNPSIRWPGTTWQAIETFLLGASSTYPVGSTGGEFTHRLTGSEMQYHNHGVYIAGTGSVKVEDAINRSAYGWYADGNSNSGSANTITTFKGGDQPHNNTPPLYSGIHLGENSITPKGGVHK